MAEQQQQRVHFYHQDNGSSSSESRLEAPHCPSMEGSASVDQSVNTPTPPGGGSVDRMVAMRTPAPNMDHLERMCNATIPHAPSSRMEMMDAQPQPLLNTDHPQQSTSTKVTNSQRQPCMITGEDINQGEEPDHGHTVDFGDMPTLEEHQALEQAELAMSDVDDDFLCVLHTFKLWHGAGFPPSNIPYDKDLDGHIISRVQHVEAGQYMVDMINLLEVSQHPHVGYSLQSYTGEGAGSPHTGDRIAGKLLSIVASMFPCIPAMPRGPGSTVRDYFDYPLGDIGVKQEFIGEDPTC
ncbi:hypothetical protein F5141DRAFT_1064220 [Pisolithus sp. B1]|nr:hypothetical protein F5141DRAFT_1064220 [Pisolithus sp. B1]